MTKKVRARSAGLLALVLAAGGFVATSTVAGAQYQSGYRRDSLSTASDRMRQWARELDQVASNANRQAQADQAGYRGSRRDGNFLKSIRDFAARTSQFRSKMDSYRTSQWNVDGELDRLVRDARNVQNRIERARFVDASTRRDWTGVVDLLNRMQNEYRYPGYASSRDYYSTSDLRQLARELDERAARMAQLASVSGTRYGTRYGYSSEVRRLSEEARNFRDEIENRNFPRSELRSRVNRLLDDARNAHSEITTVGADSRVTDEWDGIVRVLDRMRNLVV